LGRKGSIRRKGSGEKGVGYICLTLVGGGDLGVAGSRPETYLTPNPPQSPRPILPGPISVLPRLAAAGLRPIAQCACRSRCSVASSQT
jgi:hypothetical protein